MFPQILILGIPNDYHEIAVSWGLRQFGIHTTTIMSGDLPDKVCLSVRFESETTRLLVKQQDFRTALELREIGLVWNRRMAEPVAPDNCDSSDKRYVERECYEFFWGIRALLSSQCKIVNDPSKSSAATKKVCQIGVARSVGLAVPNTLISNDYDEISLFCAENVEVVFKPFHVMSWRKSDDIFTFYASDFHLPSPKFRCQIELAPQIYQQKIDRDFEVRLIIFGSSDFSIAQKVDGQDETVDIRTQLRNKSVTFSHCNAPRDIVERCRLYMKAMCIDYGAFDLIVDRLGNWVFIECNEGGQFLYLEHALPDIGIFDAFCRWFCNLLGIEHAHLPRKLTLRDFDQTDSIALARKRDRQYHKTSVVRGGRLIDESESTETFEPV